MNSLEFTALIFAGSLLVEFLGALTGLGGGVVVMPLLTVIFSRRQGPRRFGKSADFGSKVVAELPKPSGVKGQPVPLH